MSKASTSHRDRVFFFVPCGPRALGEPAGWGPTAPTGTPPTLGRPPMPDTTTCPPHGPEGERVQPGVCRLVAPPQRYSTTGNPPRTTHEKSVRGTADGTTTELTTSPAISPTYYIIYDYITYYSPGY